MFLMSVIDWKRAEFIASQTLQIQTCELILTGLSAILQILRLCSTFAVIIDRDLQSVVGFETHVSHVNGKILTSILLTFKCKFRSIYWARRLTDHTKTYPNLRPYG